MQFEKTSVILQCQMMDLNLRLSVHPYFSSKPPRTFWLYPSDSCSETSACPLGPDEKTHETHEYKKLSKIFDPWYPPLLARTCRESRSFSKSSSRSAFCCSCAFRRSGQRFWDTLEQVSSCDDFSLTCRLKWYLSWCGRAPRAASPW